MIVKIDLDNNKGSVVLTTEYGNTNFAKIAGIYLMEAAKKIDNLTNEKADAKFIRPKNN